MWDKFRQRKILWALIIMLPILSVLAALLTLTLTNTNRSTVYPPTFIPTPPHRLTTSSAPNFELLELNTDRTVRLSSLRGQVVFINFWATWCEPCRREFPAFQDYVTQADPTGVILAVNVGEHPQKINPFLTEVGARDVTILLDTDFNVSDTYNANFFPTTFIIDAAGIVQAVHIGEITLSDLQLYAAEYAS